MYSPKAPASPGRPSRHVTEPQAHIHTTCDDCVVILTDAASLLASKSQAPMEVFDAAYQIRLSGNISSSQCHMCTLLGVNIPKLLEPFDPREVRALAISRARNDQDAATVVLFGFDREDLGQQTFYPGSLRIQRANHGHVRVLESPTTWSLETLNSLQSWLKNCILSHDDCPKPQATSRLPLRLLDVMPAGSRHVWPTEELRPEEFGRLSLENLPTVRIVSSHGLPPDSPYLTLSHRWGDPPSVLLKKDTLFLLKEDISCHLLNFSEAAVFRHAIHVTRCLGFRYLWIDALCIMQDDGPEKTAEIMQMDEIYLNSSLNISAMEGRAREGLVFDREPLRNNPCRATVRIPETGEDIHLQAFPDKSFIRASEGPLNKRGWVFQERTLAPRIAHFTGIQVFWECHSLEASEVLPLGIPGRPSARLSKGLGITSAPSVQQVKCRWYDLVEGYSGTSLTFADDRLLAISAVAKRFCSAMRLAPSEYLAGMWRDDLPLSMLWSQDVDRPRPTTGIETEMKNAPSWSWASVLAPVSSVELHSLVTTAEVLRVQITRISPNFFDGADPCVLRLRGHMCKFRRRAQDGLFWIHVGQHTKFQEANEFTFQRGKVLMLYWDTSRAVVSDWLNASGSRASVPSSYFFFHLASEQSVDGPIERGVILRRTAVRGTYARIGTFFTPLECDYPGSELEAAFSGRLHTLCADDYLELGADKKCTIDVV